jgi:transporter family-2 protein
MVNLIAFAALAGVLVGVSRQVNGRLSLSTSPLVSSFWNHLVGFALLTVIGLVLGGLITPGAATAPWYSFIGGPLGVVFVAAGSWLIPRIGATNTALLIIGGQMISGVALDLLSTTPRPLLWSALGVALILAGMVLTQRRR